MKLRKSYLLLLLSCITSPGFSQHNSFDLSTYKLPEIKRQTLETYFNMKGSTYHSNYLTDGNESPNILSDNYLLGSYSLLYTGYLNNQKTQRSISAGINLSGSNYSTYYDDRFFQSYNRSIGPSLTFSMENRSYLTGKFFLEADPYFSDNFGYTTKKAVYTNDSSIYVMQTISNIVSFAVPLKAGAGRIEPVQDARLAVYLLDELAKEARISGGQSDEEVIELASLISRLKNERYFDSRIRKAQELEAIDSFLIAKNYLMKSDAHYFTTMTDFWDYGDGPVRQSGTRYNAFISPGIYYKYYNNTAENAPSIGKNTFKALSARAGIEYTREKPVNLYWQNSTYINLSAGLGNTHYYNENDGDEYTYILPDFQARFSHTVGFYPNTRTSMYMEAYLRYARFFDRTDTVSGVYGLDLSGINTGLSASLNYYISPRLRVNGTFTLDYSAQHSMTNSDNLLADSNYDLYYTYLTNSSYYQLMFREKRFETFLYITLLYSIF